MTGLSPTDGARPKQLDVLGPLQAGKLEISHRLGALSTDIFGLDTARFHAIKFRTEDLMGIPFDTPIAEVFQVDEQTTLKKPWINSLTIQQVPHFDTVTISGSDDLLLDEVNGVRMIEFKSWDRPTNRFAILDTITSIEKPTDFPDHARYLLRIKKDLHALRRQPVEPSTALTGGRVELISPAKAPPVSSHELVYFIDDEGNVGKINLERSASDHSTSSGEYGQVEVEDIELLNVIIDQIEARLGIRSSTMADAAAVISNA